MKSESDKNMKEGKKKDEGKKGKGKENEEGEVEKMPLTTTTKRKRKIILGSNGQTPKKLKAITTTVVPHIPNTANNITLLAEKLKDYSKVV